MWKLRGVWFTLAICNTVGLGYGDACVIIFFVFIVAGADARKSEDRAEAWAVWKRSAEA